MVELVSDYVAIRKIDIEPRAKLIKVVTPDEEAGKVLKPESFDEHPFQGIVVAVGSGFILPDGKRKKMCCRAGDRVIYRPSVSTRYEWIILNGEVLMLMRDSDIIGVVT